MTISNILVPICFEIPPYRQFDASLQLARRLQGHIDAVFFRLDPMPHIAIPEAAMGAGEAFTRIEQEDCEAAAASREEFSAWQLQNLLADRPGKAPSASWSECAGRLEARFIPRARLADLIVLHRPTPFTDGATHLFNAAVFDSGRPTLVVGDTIPPDLLDHVVVAWNGSLEASRAVSGAEPLLHAARQVSVFTASTEHERDPDGPDLVEALAWHGIRADRMTTRSGERSAGAALLSASRERDATLVIMCAYTHSRVRQMLLGGVTSHMLQHAEIPFLMTH